MNELTQKTIVWIYEDGERLIGEIVECDGESYTVKWDDGEVTVEPVEDFDPVGWK